MANLDRRLLIVALMGLPAAAAAHHSWRAVYDGGEEVTVEAVVTSQVFRNPHWSLRVDLITGSGARAPWTIEWRGDRRRDCEPPVVYDIKRGDKVRIAGRIARAADTKKIQMQTLIRPADGMTITARRRGERRSR
jgi:hypothetical protein